MRKRALAPLGIFLALLVFLGVGLERDPTEVPSPFIGKPAPQFTLPDLNRPGQTVSGDMFAGRPWILNVWASWCAPCRQEHPLFNELAGRNLVSIVGLNYKDRVDDARNWLAALGDPYSAVASDTGGGVGIDFGVYGVPETFVIDARGVIRMKHVGPVTREVMESEILPLLRSLL